VIDLRSEPPVRHRQSRGVPREPDARMRAYRDRPVHPPISGASVRRRPLEVAALFHDGGPRGAIAAPTDEREDVDMDMDMAASDAAVDTPPRSEPTMSTYQSSDGRRRILMGQLVVKRLRLRSVAKVALAFYLCLWAVVALAGTILWSLANREGWVTGWTGFLVGLGFTDAAVDGPTLARASAAAGGIVLVTVTLLTVAAAFFYNQLSGLIGGVEVTLASTKRRRGAG